MYTNKEISAYYLSYFSGPVGAECDKCDRYGLLGRVGEVALEQLPWAVALHLCLYQ